MVKEVLFWGAGVVAGAAICYGVYRYYQSRKNDLESKNEEDIFDEKLKKKEEDLQRFNELVANQSYVELLTSKELSEWFKENRGQFGVDVKMLIITPTEENMKGLGFFSNGDLNIDTNIVQLFYDEHNSKVLKIRLINYTDIESNLQVHLIEQEGMIVVTD